MRYMISLTQSILAHVNEVCRTVLPVMNTSTEMTTTSTLQLGEYTVTITLSKRDLPSVLGKRHAQEDVSHPYERRPFRSDIRLSEFEIHPTSESILYNNFGHNFSSTHPHPQVNPVAPLSYII